MLLLVALQVRRRPCLVIGAGDVGKSRVAHLLHAGAHVTVVAPAVDIAGVTAVNRPFVFDDLNHPYACVCCCIDDPVLSEQIYHKCKELRLLVNIADRPPMCDFYFGLVLNHDNVQIMISTNGRLPRLARAIKDDIARHYENVDLARAVENLGRVRDKLREKVPQNDVDTIEKRMQWITRLTDSRPLREWALMDVTEEAAEALVAEWGRGSAGEGQSGAGPQSTQ